MKKILLSAALVLAFALSAGAQASIGVGYVGSTLKGSDVSSYFNGFSVGASYNLKFTEQLGVAPGVYYTRVSTQEAKLFPGLPYTGRWSENFVDIPVHLNAIFDFGLVDFGVYAGPSFNFDVGDFLTASDGSKSASLNMVDSKYIKMFDLQLGVGAMIFIGPVSLRAGYSWGLLDKNGENLGNYKLNRNQFNVGIAYLFDSFGR